MSQIIDRSEHMSLLTVSAGDTVTIEKDADTPKRENRVHVTAQGISLGIGSTVLLQDHGTLSLTGLGSVSLLGSIDIGDNGKLQLRGEIGVGVLSSVSFVGDHAAPAVLLIDTSDLNLPGAVNGFGLNDMIKMEHLVANSVEYTPNFLGGGGEVTFYEGSTEVGQIGLTGNYTGDNFALKPYEFQNGDYGTALSYVPNGEIRGTPMSTGSMFGASHSEHATQSHFTSHGW